MIRSSKKLRLFEILIQFLVTQLQINCRLKLITGNYSKGSRSYLQLNDLKFQDTKAIEKWQPNPETHYEDKHIKCTAHGKKSLKYKQKLEPAFKLLNLLCQASTFCQGSDLQSWSLHIPFKPFHLSKDIEWGCSH